MNRKVNEIGIINSVFDTDRFKNQGCCNCVDWEDVCTGEKYMALNIQIMMMRVSSRLFLKWIR